MWCTLLHWTPTLTRGFPWRNPSCSSRYFWTLKTPLKNKFENYLEKKICFNLKSALISYFMHDQLYFKSVHFCLHFIELPREFHTAPNYPTFRFIVLFLKFFLKKLCLEIDRIESCKIFFWDKPYMHVSTRIINLLIYYILYPHFVLTRSRPAPTLSSTSTTTLSQVNCPTTSSLERRITCTRGSSGATALRLHKRIRRGCWTALNHRLDILQNVDSHQTGNLLSPYGPIYGYIWMRKRAKKE